MLVIHTRERRRRQSVLRMVDLDRWGRDRPCKFHRPQCQSRLQANHFCKLAARPDLLRGRVGRKVALCHCREATKTERRKADQRDESLYLVESAPESLTLRSAL